MAPANNDELGTETREEPRPGLSGQGSVKADELGGDDAGRPLGAEGGKHKKGKKKESGAKVKSGGVEIEEARARVSTWAKAASE